MPSRAWPSSSTLDRSTPPSGAERYGWAERVLSRLIDAARQRSTPTEVTYPLRAAAQLELRRGRFELARAHADEAVRMALDTGQAVMASVGLSALGDIDASLGNRAACDEHFAQVDKLIGILGVDPGRLRDRSNGLLALVEGEPDRAVAALEAVEESDLERGTAEPRILQWAANLIEARAWAGDEARPGDARLGGGGRGADRWSLERGRRRARPGLLVKMTSSTSTSDSRPWRSSGARLRVRSAPHRASLGGAPSPRPAPSGRAGSLAPGSQYVRTCRLCPARGSSSPRARGDRRVRRPRNPGAPRRAHASGAAHRPPGCGGPDQSRGCRRAFHQPQDGRAPPLADLPQARDPFADRARPRPLA